MFAETQERYMREELQHSHSPRCDGWLLTQREMDHAGGLSRAGNVFKFVNRGAHSGIAHVHFMCLPTAQSPS